MHRASITCISEAQVALLFHTAPDTLHHSGAKCFAIFRGRAHGTDDRGFPLCLQLWAANGRRGLGSRTARVKRPPRGRAKCLALRIGSRKFWKDSSLHHCVKSLRGLRLPGCAGGGGKTKSLAPDGRRSLHQFVAPSTPGGLIGFDRATAAFATHSGVELRVGGVDDRALFGGLHEQGWTAAWAPWLHKPSAAAARLQIQTPSVACVDAKHHELAAWNALQLRQIKYSADFAASLAGSLHPVVARLFGRHRTPGRCHRRAAHRANVACHGLPLNTILILRASWTFVCEARVATAPSDGSARASKAREVGHAVYRSSKGSRLARHRHERGG